MGGLGCVGGVGCVVGVGVGGNGCAGMGGVGAGRGGVVSVQEGCVDPAVGSVDSRLFLLVCRCVYICPFVYTCSFVWGCCMCTRHCTFRCEGKGLHGSCTVFILLCIRCVG
ncbi:hypothetical protein B484DRAFT_443032 [Ochromonadaceae sp. CCMP2298]|nr:hypothetical protein B484DRAFT_443032 [Ochromonadaceae sp. CCMP2298]